MMLTIAVILFIIVIALIVYANWPKNAYPCNQCGMSGRRCGCSSNSCNQCGMPRRRCGCNKPPGCPFC